MPDPNAQFVGSIPEIYDRHLGPVLFEPYARDLVGRVVFPAACRVLELACGTGILTRQLQEHLPPGGRLMATDFNDPMMAYARARLRRDERVQWRQADATSLPFPSEAFDLVICQFGIMFFPDKVAAAREVRRVLAAGGRFLFNVWDRLELNSVGRIAHETIARFFPHDPPTFYQVPCGFFQHDALRSLLSQNGFADIEITPVALEGRSPSARHLAMGLVEGNPVVGAIRERGGVETSVVIDAIAEELAPGRSWEPLSIQMNAIVVSGRAA